VIRIKIVRRPSTPVVDGIRFGDFEIGLEYLVGPVTAGLLLAEGWGVPIDTPSPPQPSHEPVHVVRREIDPTMPPNLIREYWPASAAPLRQKAADRKRRRTGRR